MPSSPAPAWPPRSASTPPGKSSPPHADGIREGEARADPHGTARREPRPPTAVPPASAPKKSCPWSENMLTKAGASIYRGTGIPVPVKGMTQTALQIPMRLLQWVRTPQQARTRDSLGRMLDAAEQLVADKGFDDTGIAEIARAAGTSVGAFYRRFRDKHGLLHALHERFCDEARATADAALDPARWAGARRPTSCASSAPSWSRSTASARASSAPSCVAALSDERFARRTRSPVRAPAPARSRLLLAERRAEIAHPDPKLGCGLRPAMSSSARSTHAFAVAAERCSPPRRRAPRQPSSRAPFSPISACHRPTNAPAHPHGGASDDHPTISPRASRSSACACRRT